MHEKELQLVAALRAIEVSDTMGDYDRRYRLIIHAMALATEVGMQVGIRLDPGEPEWPVVYIELPTGQVTWHMPQHSHEWDGHDTQEKYRRVRDYVWGATHR